MGLILFYHKYLQNGKALFNLYHDSTSKTQILLQRVNFAWRHVVKFAAEIAAI